MHASFLCIIYIIDMNHIHLVKGCHASWKWQSGEFIHFIQVLVYGLHQAKVTQVKGVNQPGELSDHKEFYI